MVEWPVGSCSPYLRCTAIAASEISLKKSARQYHWSPAGYRPSNALCRAVNGIGCTPTSSGEPKLVTGPSTSSARSCGPV